MVSNSIKDDSIFHAALAWTFPLEVPLMGLLKLVVSSTESMPEHYRTMFFQAIHGHDGVFDDDDIALLLEAENDGTEVVREPSPRDIPPRGAAEWWRGFRG